MALWVFGRPRVKRFPYAIGPLSASLSVCVPCNVGVLWPNGSMDQDATWCGGKLRLRPHYVGWEPSSPQNGAQQPPLSGPCLLWPSDWMDQDSTGYVGWPRSRQHCVRSLEMNPAPTRERNTVAPPLFGPCLLCPKRSPVSATTELLSLCHFMMARICYNPVSSVCCPSVCSFAASRCSVKRGIVFVGVKS